MFKLNIDQQFNEPVDLERAKVLLKIPDSKFKSLIWVDDNNNDNGEFWNPDTYIRCAKKFLLEVVNNNGINTNSYKYSKNMIDCGRQYANKFGVQSLQKQLRGYLTSNKLIDFDMVNMHPTALLYICKRFYPHYQWTEITEYVNNRSNYLTKYKLDKIKVLKMMNSNFLSTKLNLDQEFKSIQTLLYDKTPDCLEFMNKYKTEKQNAKGKFLNKILCIFENMILHSALSTMPTDSVKVKMFDGFMADASINVSDTIINLNDATKEYGIKWSVKEPDTSVTNLLKDIEIDTTEEIKNYENVKNEFEKTHFMIEDPLLFGREYFSEGVKKYSLYNSSDFVILTKPFIYEDLENGKLVKKSIYNRWLTDNNKRSYKNISFIPSLTKYDPNIYNTFQGFNYDTTNKEYKTHPTVVQDFINHIGLLSDFEQPSIDYINKYIAHIIQKTTQNPQICLIFKSIPGFGKDLLISFIEKMLGVNYIARTAEVNDIFGRFNSIIKDKILLQVNELEGKDGFGMKEKIKNFITEEKTVMREKNVKAYTQNNYIRFIICSNNLTPVEITTGSRRFCVFQCTQPKPADQYFDNLIDYLTNKDALYTLYDYYNNLDISDFVPKNSPITNAYTTMRQHNHLYKYINDMFKDEEFKNEFEGEFKTHKATKDVIIQPNSIMRRFKHWLSCENITNCKIDFKIMKGLLSTIGVNQKNCRAGGSTPTIHYVFKLEALREKLKDLQLDDDLYEQDGEDDWE
jgi:hypothetical protein